MLIREVIQDLNDALSINIFAMKEEEVTLRSEEKDSICSHCPKRLFLNCALNWKVGNEIAKKYQEPYYYFCPLNLTLAIIPIYSRDKREEIDYLCIGPITIKDLSVHCQNIPEDLRIMVKNMYVPFRMKVLNNQVFKKYVKIAYLSFLGLENLKKTSGEMIQIFEEELPELEGGDKNRENIQVEFYQQEQKVLNCLKTENKEQILSELYVLIQLLKIKENNQVEAIKKNCVQIYYLFYRKGVKWGIEPEYSNQLHKDLGKRIEYAEKLEDIVKIFIHSILTIVDLLKPLNPYHNNIMVYNVQKYVEAHYKEELSLKRVAEELNVSYSYLSNVFNKEAKIKFNDYLQGVRVKESTILLKQTNMDLASISLETGFSSQSYFTKIFHKHLGVSPRQYRISCYK